MRVSIRLLRYSCRKRPFYRVIAANSWTTTISRISGKDISKQMGLNFERVKYGLSVGDQPSDPVQNLLFRAGVLPPPPMVAM